MASTQSQQAYGQSTGTTPTNFNWLATRDPGTNDTNYPIGTFWQNTSIPKLWYLNSKSLIQGVLSATWELISVSSVLSTLSDTDNTPVFPSSPTASPPNNIQLVAGSGMTITSDPGSNLITLTASVSADSIETITGNDSVAVGGTGSPVNINVVGDGSITTSGDALTNTETIALTGLTESNVLVGQGTSTVGLVAPPATVGVPLISQNAISYPVFGTALVAGGGTGKTSFTAYSVICGGTTGTGNLQNVSGVGTSGYVLTSNGAAALPTWQAIPSGAFTWSLITASQNLAANNGYFCISPGGALSLALPTSGATVGTAIEVVLDGATSWTITQGVGQQIRFGNQQTTSGAGGSLASNKQGDSVRLICEVLNTRWVVVSSIGLLTVT